MTNQELSIIYFLLLAAILISVRIVGYLGNKLGQFQVVCEMIAGVLLGPSFLGWLFPNVYSYIFPKQAISVVYCISQVGLALYMFIIGTEFNIHLINKKLRSALSISLAGILVPFVLGGIFVFMLGKDPILFNTKITIWEAIAFTGCAMSITAFPMLARIIFEKGLSGTQLGTLILAAGSIDDVTAWCLLAVVIGSINGNIFNSCLTIFGGTLYLLIVLFLVKPILDKYTKIMRTDNSALLCIILILVMLGAYFTDYIGLYAVFGSFIMGLSIPRGKLQEELIAKIEPLTTNFLLPLFFVYSGLNTQFKLLLSSKLIMITIIIILIACIGKGVACWTVARFNKLDKKASLVVGVLMNSRGLMELILINIGLEKGVITYTYYTIMVIMALTTTIIVSPLLKQIYDNNMGFRSGKNSGKYQHSIFDYTHET